MDNENYVNEQESILQDKITKDEQELKKYTA
jgi:hypothetical protein